MKRVFAEFWFIFCAWEFKNITYACICALFGYSTEKDLNAASNCLFFNLATCDIRLARLERQLILC